MILSVSLGLLIARLIVGLYLAGHGAQKLFGWYGGYGPAGTGKFFEGLGFRPGATFAVAAGLAEFVGGLMTALGLLSPIGPALIVMIMIVAIFTVHVDKGFWNTDGGFELPLTNIAAALAVASTGPGAFSLDALIGFTTLSSPLWTWGIMGVAVVLALLNLAVRRKPPAPAA